MLFIICLLVLPIITLGILFWKRSRKNLHHHLLSNTEEDRRTSASSSSSPDDGDDDLLDIPFSSPLNDAHPTEAPNLIDSDLFSVPANLLDVPANLPASNPPTQTTTSLLDTPPSVLDTPPSLLDTPAGPIFPVGNDLSQQMPFSSVSPYSYKPQQMTSLVDALQTQLHDTSLHDVPDPIRNTSLAFEDLSKFMIK